MRFIAKAVFAIVATATLAAQSTQQPLTYAAVSNITSTSTVIDNRSSFTRQSDYHGFCATGSGTWSATIQYSDVSSAGPWITFPYGTTVVNNSSATCYGYSFTYKPFIRFLISGTVSVNYTGMKSFWLPVVQSVSSINADAPLVYSSGTLSIPAATGSVNGYLTSTDWGTFNSKENTLTFSSPLVRSTNTITLPSFPWASLTGIPSALVRTDQVNTYSSGQKQIFAPSGTTAGFNFGAAASAPSSSTNGDSYYDTTLLSSRVYVGSAWRSHLIAPTSGTGLLKWDGSATTAAAILNSELPAAFDISSNTSTAPIKAGTTLPGTCSTPQLFFDTDATPGQNLYACTSTNNWTLQSGGGGGGSVAIQVDGTPIGSEPTINFIPSPGVLVGGVDAGSVINVTLGADTGFVLSRNTGASGVDNTCIPVSASPTAYTCAPLGNALSAYTNGMRLMFRPDVTCSGSPNLNISSLGAKNLYAADGTTAASCTAGLSYPLIYNAALNAGAGGWVFPATGGGGVSAQRGAFGSIPTCNSGNTGLTYYFTDSNYGSAWCDGTVWRYAIGTQLVSALPSTTFAGSNATATTANGGVYLSTLGGAIASYDNYETVGNTGTRTFYLEPQWFGGAADSTIRAYVGDGTNDVGLMVGWVAGAQVLRATCGTSSGATIGASLKSVSLDSISGPTMSRIWIRLTWTATDVTAAVGFGPNANFRTFYTGAARATCSVAAGSVTRAGIKGYANGTNQDAAFWLGAQQ